MPYRSVYKPAPDIYRGPETESFKPGEFYKDWIANDFTMIKGSDGKWHVYGIIHPKPPTFINEYDYSGDVHEAENQLFHCVYEGTLDQLYNGGEFEEKDKVLRPDIRPQQDPNCWAPCMYRKGDEYHMLYTPAPVRIVTTKDMYDFQVHDLGLFEGAPGLRDLYIIQEDGLYYVVYVSDNLNYRTSTDLFEWSEEKLFQKNPFSKGSAQESPCIIRRNGMYYLFWCIYDGQYGSYDSRTYVYASEDLLGFNDKAPIAMLYGHAVEIVTENGQDYIISVYHPENGLSIAKITWE